MENAIVNLPTRFIAFYQKYRIFLRDSLFPVQINIEITLTRRCYFRLVSLLILYLGFGIKLQSLLSNFYYQSVLYKEYAGRVS